MNIFVLVLYGLLGLVVIGNLLVKGEPKQYQRCWRCTLVHYFNKISICQACFRKLNDVSGVVYVEPPKKYIKFHGLDA